jgi:hypothetical protein
MPFCSNVGLREWLDEFISTTFLQHIKLDYKKRAVISTEGTEAFKSKDKIIRDSSNEEQRPVLNVRRLENDKAGFGSNLFFHRALAKSSIALRSYTWI